MHDLPYGMLMALNSVENRSIKTTSGIHLEAKDK